MLSSVLPGLRELRAPLSAGFLWLLTLWFAFERAVPDSADASGAVASAYRLGGLLETIGLGAAITFAAYLVGSLSVFLFTGLLRRVMRASPQPPRNWRDTLSPGAWQALQEVVDGAAQRLNAVLSLSGLGIDDAIDQFRQGPRGPNGSPTMLRAQRPRWWRRRLAKYGRPREYALLPAEWELPDERARRRLSELVVLDLPVIASTRLLGKHPDIFSAVDRDRAEVEFRLAVVPPVLALAIAVASHESAWLGLLIVIVGGAIVVGLLLDAINQQRQANDLILDLLQVNEITAPSLERLEAWAADRADRTPSKLLARHIGELSRSIRTLLSYVVIGRLSAPVTVLADGANKLARAQQEFAAVRAMFPPPLPVPVADLAERLLERLDGINRQWRRYNAGAIGPDADGATPEPVVIKDLSEEIDTAHRDFDTLVKHMQDAIVDTAGRAAANQTAAELS